MATATHDPNITINITLDAAPAESAGFGTLLILLDKATNDLDGATVVEFATVAEAEALALTAGALSADGVAAVTAALAQTPKPASVKVGWIDLTGLETYSAAIARINAYDPDWYALAIDSGSDASILAAAAAIASYRKIGVFQSNEAGFLTGTYPGALAALATNDRAVVVYHDDDGIWADAAYAASRLVFDPDVISAAWDGPVAGVTPNASITTTQRNYAIGNDVNIGLPYGGSAFYVDPGVTATGRAVYEVVTADWFHARVEAAIAAAKAAHAARGAKFTIDAVGQAKIVAIVEGLFAQGVGAGHFAPGGTEITAAAITSADLAAFRMRFTGRAQIATSARIFTFDLNFSRDALA